MLLEDIIINHYLNLNHLFLHNQIYITKYYHHRLLFRLLIIIPIIKVIYLLLQLYSYFIMEHYQVIYLIHNHLNLLLLV